MVVVLIVFVFFHVFFVPFYSLTFLCGETTDATNTCCMDGKDMDVGELDEDDTWGMIR